MTDVEVEPTVLRVGDLAYFLSFSAPLIKVKVVRVETPGEGRKAIVKVKVTAADPPYGWESGEEFNAAGDRVLPRSHVFRARGQYHIKGIPVRFE